MLRFGVHCYYMLALGLVFVRDFIVQIIYCMEYMFALWSNIQHKKQMFSKYKFRKYEKNKVNKLQ